MNRRLGACWVAALALAACGGASDRYDLVIVNGTVLDPESGFFEPANVGVLDGTIAAVTSQPLRGTREIDAAGMIVAPGFVDLHEHGQMEESYELMVRDGVTSALELEVGTGSVAEWYAARDGGQIVNYGVSIGHVQVRMNVFDDPGLGLVPAGVGGSGTASDEELDEIEASIRRGLDEGAVAVGFGTAYTPGADMAEVSRMFEVAAEYGAPAHVHIRGGTTGLDSTIVAAREAGASLHIVHANSSAGGDLEAFLATIEAAAAAGQDVTTETYPYGAGMTEITSALFDDWESWPDERFGDHQFVPTGERLDRAGFEAARAAGGMVIIHSRSEELTRSAVASPLTMIASDGHVEGGQGHPRTSGSYAKVLGRYVRDEGVLSLEEAVAKMTIRPARRLEARAPVFLRKGRLSVGMDADITVFDAARVADRATYEDPTATSVGIPYVIIGGSVVVDEGQLTGAEPGLPLRAAQAGNEAR
jgi:N-acyl-D-aspartate/D-glutamate deacylase